MINSYKILPKQISRKKGFTLIELLVVIAVIAILAGLVIVRIGNTSASARDSRRKADMDQISKALEMYYNKNGQYPCCAGDSEASYSSMTATLISAGFLSISPQDLQYSSKRYHYDNWCANPATSGDSQYYRLWVDTETPQGGLQYNWWNDYFVGATNCTDPS